MITGKNLDRIAKVLAECRPDGDSEDTGLEVWISVVQQMTEFLKQQNPNVQPDRFKRACGFDKAEELLTSWGKHPND